MRRKELSCFPFGSQVCQRIAGTGGLWLRTVELVPGEQVGLFNQPRPGLGNQPDGQRQERAGRQPHPRLDAVKDLQADSLDGWATYLFKSVPLLVASRLMSSWLGPFMATAGGTERSTQIITA